jgi:DNA-binding response OmpR family regulator
MKILVVEDEHRIAQSIKKGLELERHTVDISFNGSDGYDLASSEPYDILILDRMLPGMDGLELCRQLRRDGNHTPVLLLTAKSAVEDKVEGLDAGADDYLPKPFSFDELLARLRALGRRERKLQTEILTIADLTVNTSTYEVARGGTPIQLTSREFTILEYLLRHTNTIVNKDTLIASVWDYDADILPNTVEVYIKNLRTKIDLPFSDRPKLIQTVRGFGYKLVG